ncbi:MAG: rRNA pseudouridine synthase [Planctomycetales bacterium]|nr:rRNA pseudouridine synthase [Planctomycetales bacterium]
MAKKRKSRNPAGGNPRATAKKHARRGSGPIAKPTRGPKPKPPGRRRARKQYTSDDTRPRLQKVLAAAGLGSRRACEEIILDGRVEVDRQVVMELGTRVDLETQQVRVDGTVIKPPKMCYFLVNKPVDVISTARDPWARLRVIDLINSEERVFTVGRLDRASSGLILVTNDGILANQLAHPRYGVTKTYQATVSGRPTTETLAKLRKGIHLAEAVARVVTVKLKKAHPQKSVLEIVLSEGRNREIRRMLARVNHKVLQLKRTALGPVKLGDIPAGAYRELTRDEIKKLRAAIASPSERGRESSKGNTKSRTSKPGKQAAGKKETRSKSERRSSGSKERSAGTVIGGEYGSQPKTARKKKSSSPRRTKRKQATGQHRAKTARRNKR